MRLRDRVTAAVGLAAIVASVLVIGGALRWSQAVVAGLVAIALIPNITARRVHERISPLVAVIGLAIALTAVQLVPLPAALLGVLNPMGAALREDGARLLELSPWSSASMDVAGSLRALAFFVIVLGIAVLTLKVSVTERGRFRILASVAALCGVTAIIVWLHQLLGATSVYGIYEPAHANPHLRGPLLNLNHLGCLMAVGVVLSLGLVMHTRQPNWARVSWVAVIGLCGSLTLATVSRGATLALGVGVVVVGAAIIGQRLSGPERATRRWGDVLTKSIPIAVIALCAVIVVIYSSAGNVGRALESTSFSEIQRSRTKFAAWKASSVLVEEAPWLGVGRGAFEPSFTRVYPDAGFSTFSHTENAYLQTVIDWGIVGGLAIGAALLWFAVVALRRWKDGPLTAGALGALAVVGIQSNVDFGIELLALAAPMTAIAATVAYVPLREATGRGLARAYAFRIAHVLALVAAAVVLLSAATTTIAEDHDALDAGSTLDEIRASLQRHPLDYLGFARAAQALDRTEERTSIQLLNHALRLHPTHPGLHRMAARYLLRDGHPAQAAQEYAVAIRVGGEPQKLIAELVTLFTPAQAETAIPIDYPQVEPLVQILDDLGRRDVALGWLIRVRAHRPHSAVVCELIYKQVLRDKNLTSLPAARRACGDVPGDPQLRLTLVQLLATRGAHGDVIRVVGDVADWTGQVETKVAGWLALCDARTALKQWDESKHCLRQLDASGLVAREGAEEIKTRLDTIARERAVVPVVPTDAPATDAPPL